MDITPPQEMTDYMKSSRGGEERKWILLLGVAAFIVVGVWITWRNGWSPFGEEGTLTERSQKTESDMLASLSASRASAHSSEISLSELTPPASPTKKKTTDVTSILDSLTPKH